MIRHFSRLMAAAGFAICMISALPALAAETWQRLHSAQDNFEAMSPGNPTLESQAVSGIAGAVQRVWRKDIGAASFQLAAISYPAGRIPASPDTAFYDRLIAAYAKGSNTKLRSRYPTVIAGRPGAEAIFDGLNGADEHHLWDCVAIGNTLYMVVSGGPKGHEASADAVRFRNSFQLIKQ